MLDFTPYRLYVRKIDLVYLFINSLSWNKKREEYKVP